MREPRGPYPRACGPTAPASIGAPRTTALDSPGQGYTSEHVTYRVQPNGAQRTVRAEDFLDRFARDVREWHVRRRPIRYDEVPELWLTYDDALVVARIAAVRLMLGYTGEDHLISPGLPDHLRGARVVVLNR